MQNIGLHPSRLIADEVADSCWSCDGDLYGEREDQCERCRDADDLADRAAEGTRCRAYRERHGVTLGQIEAAAAHDTRCMTADEIAEIEAGVAESDPDTWMPGVADTVRRVMAASDETKCFRASRLRTLRTLTVIEYPNPKSMWLDDALVTALDPYETADRRNLCRAYNVVVEMRHDRGTQFGLADLLETAERDADQMLDAMQAVVSGVERPCLETWQASLREGAP